MVVGAPLTSCFFILKKYSSLQIFLPPSFVFPENKINARFSQQNISVWSTDQLYIFYFINSTNIYSMQNTTYPLSTFGFMAGA